MTRQIFLNFLQCRISKCDWTRCCIFLNMSARISGITAWNSHWILFYISCGMKNYSCKHILFDKPLIYKKSGDTKSGEQEIKKFITRLILIKCDKKQWFVKHTGMTSNILVFFSAIFLFRKNIFKPLYHLAKNLAEVRWQSNRFFLPVWRILISFGFIKL